MGNDLNNKVEEENKYMGLVQNNPKYRVEGWDRKTKKYVVGVIKGDPEKYNQGTDTLEFKHFESWKEAYIQLTSKK